MLMLTLPYWIVLSETTKPSSSDPNPITYLYTYLTYISSIYELSLVIRVFINR